MSVFVVEFMREVGGGRLLLNGEPQKEPQKFSDKRQDLSPEVFQ